MPSPLTPLPLCFCICAFVPLCFFALVPWCLCVFLPWCLCVFLPLCLFALVFLCLCVFCAFLLFPKWIKVHSKCKCQVQVPFVNLFKCKLMSYNNNTDKHKKKDPVLKSPLHRFRERRRDVKHPTGVVKLTL